MSEKISVLMPVFNREEYIEYAIDSILNQTHKDFEFIIYNDGSTDKTVDIIKSYNDSRIILLSGQTNKGVGYARNVLLQNAKTTYACWQDSDDVSHNRRIELQLKVIKKTKGLVFCNWKWLTKRKGKWIHKSHSGIQGFATLMFPVNKKVLFNPNMKLGGEDWDWIKRMKKKYSQDCIISKTMYFVRFHNDRIGHWKKKLTKIKGTDLMKKLTYEELLKYWEEHKDE